MSVQNGQPVNAAVTNAGFLSRLTDSDTVAKVGLKNTSDVDSGNVIVNAQRAINKALDVVGSLGESDATANDYSSNNYILDGDNRKVAIEKLDTELKNVNDILPTKYDVSNPANYQTDVQVSAAIAALVDSSPAALDTLNELAAALGDDPNFASTVTTSLAGKEPTITGTTSADYYRGDKTFQPLNPTAVGLSNVTNDSQLKRSDNDFSSFTEKTSFADDDLLLIEDSAASGVKKYIRKSNLGISGGGSSHDTIFARNSAGQALPISTVVTVSGWTSVLNPLSEFNPSTGIFTAATAGPREFISGISIGDSFGNGDRVITIYDVTNSVNVHQAFRPPNTAGSGLTTQVAIAVVNCVIGHQIKITAFQSSTGSLNVSPVADRNYLSIKKV